MSLMFIRRVLFVVLACLAFCAPAQQWPQKPLRIVVPFAAGGSTDTTARIIAEWLTQRLGQSVIAENKLGAGGAIAAEYVAKAPPDGYTLLIAATPQLAIVPNMSKTPYDPVADFAPVSIVAQNAFMLAVNDLIPAKTLSEFVAYVRERPGKLSYASAGNGSVSHLTVALFLQRAGLRMEHVSYKGGAPAIADVVAGHIPLYWGNPAEVLPHAKSGKIKVLAVSGDKRSSQLPNVPTVAESGYPGFHTNTWNGIVAPAKTPQAVIDRLAAEIVAGTRDPGMVKKLEAIGVDPVGNTPAEFTAILKSDLATWAEAVKVSGAKVD